MLKLMYISKYGSFGKEKSNFINRCYIISQHITSGWLLYIYSETSHRIQYKPQM